MTLIRHGQAGTRLVYDDLSELGIEQASRLGSWFAERGPRFSTVIVGGLRRQQKTVRAMVEALRAQGTECAEPVTDSRWNEFDLDAVYAGVGPQLAKEDERFRVDFEELCAEIRDPAAPAHRAWRPCDAMVIRAWIAGRYEVEGETFAEFKQRIAAAFADVPRGENVAVVTSATPISLCIGAALQVPVERLMQLASGFNASYSQMDLRHEDARLVSFNNVPHLHEERLRTVR